MSEQTMYIGLVSANEVTAERDNFIQIEFDAAEFAAAVQSVKCQGPVDLSGWMALSSEASRELLEYMADDPLIVEEQS